MYMTDEFMQEYDAFITESVNPPADTDGFFFDRYIPGDYVQSECIHENGEYADHFPLFGGEFTPYSTFTCFDCGTEIQL